MVREVFNKERLMQFQRPPAPNLQGGQWADPQGKSDIAIQVLRPSAGRLLSSFEELGLLFNPVLQLFR